MASNKPFYEYYGELSKLVPHPHLSGYSDISAPNEIRGLIEKHDCNIFDVTYVSKDEPVRRYICTITHVPTGKVFLATENNRDIALIVVAIEFFKSGVITL